MFSYLIEYFQTEFTSCGHEYGPSLFDSWLLFRKIFLDSQLSKTSSNVTHPKCLHFLLELYSPDSLNKTA